jgi:hypothetical protein
LADSAQTANVVKGRWKMLAVLLVCAAPRIMSHFTALRGTPSGGTPQP